MALDPLTSILDIANVVLDRVLPDKTQAAAAKAALLQSYVNGDLAELQGQISTNIAEAQSNNKFAADWRPLFGYVCALAFGYVYIVQPVITTIFAAVHPASIAYFPKLDMTAMMPIALGMLGLSATHFADPINKQ